jgi:hypothetical protein
MAAVVARGSVTVRLLRGTPGEDSICCFWRSARRSSKARRVSLVPCKRCKLLSPVAAAAPVPKPAPVLEGAAPSSVSVGEDDGDLRVRRPLGAVI